MKIFREESNQTRWNTSRNASLRREGQDRQASLHMWQHVSHITACPLPQTPPPTCSSWSMILGGTHSSQRLIRTPSSSDSSSKVFLQVFEMTIVGLFLFPAFLRLESLSRWPKSIIVSFTPTPPIQEQPTVTPPLHVALSFLYWSPASQPGWQ